jgi:hypothetical protein
LKAPTFTAETTLSICSASLFTNTLHSFHPDVAKPPSHSIRTTTVSRITECHCLRNYSLRWKRRRWSKKRHMRSHVLVPIAITSVQKKTSVIVLRHAISAAPRRVRHVKTKHMKAYALRTMMPKF